MQDATSTPAAATAAADTTPTLSSRDSKREEEEWSGGGREMHQKLASMEKELKLLRIEKDKMRGIYSSQVAELQQLHAILREIAALAIPDDHCNQLLADLLREAMYIRAQSCIKGKNNN